MYISTRRIAAAVPLIAQIDVVAMFSPSFQMFWYADHRTKEIRTNPVEKTNAIPRILTMVLLMKIAFS
jgi:hypothetical protein